MPVFLGNNLGVSLGQTLGVWDDTVLLRFSQLNFTCASTRYIWYNGALYGPFGANVVAQATINSKKYCQCEEARTNYLDQDPLDFSAWTAIGSATVATNVGTAPDGNATADRLTFTAAAGDGIKCTISTIGDDEDTTHSVFVKTESGTKDFRLQILKKDGATATTSDLTATTSWQRLSQDAVDVLSGGTTPEVRILNDSGGAAGSLLLWCSQPETGVHVSSAILTSLDTRAKTETYWDAALVPAVMRDGKHALKLIPFWPSGIRVGSFDIYRLYVDATHYVGFQVYSYGSTKFRISADLGGGVSTYVLTDAITHSAQQELTLILDAAGGSIEVQGATSGDGIYTDTAWNGLASTANCYLGSSHTYVNYFNGLISEPYRP